MAQQDKKIEGLVVEIFGNDYNIGGEPKDVQPVADFVDRKMREISEAHNGRLPDAQVAILAAMEITAEFFRVMKERKVFTDKAHETVDRLTRLVEERASISVHDTTESDTFEKSRLPDALGVQDS